MVNLQKSREHHWWPVALQKYWMDRNGDVSWATPDGSVSKKRARNRKIGKISHGHTFLRNSCWETNFEDEFQSVDGAIPAVITELQTLKPLGWHPKEFCHLVRLLFKTEKQPHEICKFYRLDEDLHRNLLLLIYSLLIRSPANRFKYKNFPTRFGLKPDEDVGKDNMLNYFRIAKDTCRKMRFTNQFFVLMHSYRRPFCYGDGNLDWLTSSLLSSLRVSGRALVPLTPNLCIYFCTPRKMRSGSNCVSLTVAPWQVDWVNEIVQIYSRDQVFFRGKCPKLIEAFKKKEFLEHRQKTDGLVDYLDEIAGNKKSGLFDGRVMGLGPFE